jgi:1-aminocyclopropane-1-carboxylate deaminase
MLRLDLIHPTISGNKWFKLKRNLQYASENKYQTIVTFGGAYSNHLHASAAAAKESGLPAVGLVRGTWAAESLTPTLRDCKALGMELKFLSREDYALRSDPDWLTQLTASYTHSFIIPEGGANRHGREGAAEIAELIPADYTHVCVSVGTGTTFTGVRNALPSSVCVLGFIPMIGGAYLHETIRSHLFHDKDSHWQLFDQYHFGGFGKSNEELISFMNRFYAETTIPLDVVYTSKMMFGLRELINNNFFPASSKVLCIHTGGLQGNSSVQERLVF